MPGLVVTVVVLLFTCLSDCLNCQAISTEGVPLKQCLSPFRTMDLDNRMEARSDSFL